MTAPHSMFHVLPRCAAALGVLLSAASIACAEGPEAYKILDRNEHPLRTLSALGRQVYAAQTSGWVCAEGPRIVAFGPTLQEVDALMQQADYAFGEAGRLLALPEAPGRLAIFLVADEPSWRRLVSEQGFRPDGLALHLGDELYLKNLPARAARVAHEVVHYRLHRAYGEIPLWLDEGLAAYFGMGIARSHAAARGRRLVGQMPALVAEDVLPLDEVTGAAALPGSINQARAFYRQAEELIAELGWQHGDGTLPPFVQRVAFGENWKVVLREGYGYTPERFEELERAVRRRAMTARSL